MVKRMLSILVAVVCLAVVATPGFAALQAAGPITGPGGYPQYFTDSNNLSLQLCQDEGWCFFDPIDPTDPNQVALGIGGEVFWWMGGAAATTTAGGSAGLDLAIEGTFGGGEEIVNGNQISFARVRVRIDAPVAGTYLVEHPYGDLTFPDTPAGTRTINYTADFGAANFLDVAGSFARTLGGEIGPYLTWPDYQNDPSLQVRDAGGALLAQYVGNMDIPHVVVGSPIPDAGHPSGFRNYYRVTRISGPGAPEVIAYTDLFTVMGKVYGDQPAIAHEFPAPPTPILTAVGPINRLSDFGNDGTAAGLYAPTFLPPGSTTDGFPLGYPTYFEAADGLRLTYCPGGNPMCISEAVNPADPVQRTLGTGGESFWWSAAAAIEEVVAGNELNVAWEMALEGTFGGNEAMVDGNQITFGRTRIRIDTPLPGNYTVIYPYGEITFNNVPAGGRTINHTADVGIYNPVDPDFAHVGTLFSDIGPNFLVWPNFANRDPAFLAANPEYANLVQPSDPNVPASAPAQYVGDLNVPHVVTGGSYTNQTDPNPINYVRVLGPNGIDFRTDLFILTGKVYDPASFRVIPSALVPVAQADTATTVGTTPVAIDVLANDSLNGAPIVTANATPALVNQALFGTAMLNADKTFTYTANPGFVGSDSFTYTVSVAGQTSLAATVTVTVQPAEVVGVGRAQLDLRRLRWDIRGTANATAEGRTLTVRMGSGTGPVIGTAVVNRGRWNLRAGLNTAPPAGTVQVFVVSDSGSPAFGPFNVQIR